MPEAQQQQFDWMADSSKCIEGLRLPIGEDLIFELDFDEIELVAATKGSGDNKVVLTDDSGKPRKVYRIPFIEVQSKVKKRLDFWKNDNVRVNPSTPEVEDDFVKFSRKIGYNPQIDDEFVPKDFLKRGLRIVAKLMEEPDKKDPKKVYSKIDIATIRLAAEGESAGSQETLQSDNPELQSEVFELADGCTKFSDLVKKINKAKRTQDLLPVATKMKKDGLLDLK